MGIDRIRIGKINKNESGGVKSSLSFFAICNSNENMKKDGLNDLNIQYNYLNLTSIVSSSQGMHARYHWLTDGTKTSVFDASGANGLEYLGSLIYKRVNGELQLEGTSFGGGRIEVSESVDGAVYTPNYFIADHLGSTRAVVKLTPDGLEVLERNDYLPYGGRWDVPGVAISDNRFRFSGKEEQNSFGVPYQDFGARFLISKKLPIMTSIDPLAEVDFSTSPYTYTRNNPINAIDVEGKLTIFINGYDIAGAALHTLAKMSQEYHGQYVGFYNSDVDRGFKEEDTYGWGGLDQFYKTHYADDNALYVNGSYTPGTKASVRYDDGVAKANELIDMINSGQITLAEGEKIRLVGYSQGAAYAAGMASVLANSPYASLFEFVHYIAPHQPGGFIHPNGVLGRQIGSSKDPLSSRGKRIENIDEVNHHLGDFGGAGDLGGHRIGANFELVRFAMDVIRAGGTVTVYD